MPNQKGALIDRTKISGLSRGLIIAAVLMSLVFVFIEIANYYQTQGSWYYIDWLLNYQAGGFKRRGLSGSLMFFIQDISGLNLKTLVAVFMSIGHIVLAYFIFLLTWNKKGKALIAILLLCPIGLGVYFYGFGTAGRKEGLLIALFASYAYLALKNRINFKIVGAYMATLGVICLMHELVIFYLPYFWFVNYLHNKKSFIKNSLLLSVLVFVISVLAYFFGLELDNGTTVSLIADRGIVIKKLGILGFGVKENGFEYYMINYRYFVGLLADLSFGIILLFSYVFIVNRFYFRQFVLFFFLSFMYTLPLFYLAIDWWRWIHIHFIMSVLVAIYLSPKETLSLKELKLNWRLISLMIVIFLGHTFWKVEPILGLDVGGFIWDGIFGSN